MIHTVRGGADGDDGVSAASGSDSTSPSQINSPAGARQQVVIDQLCDRLGSLLPPNTGYSPEEAKKLVGAVLTTESSTLSGPELNREIFKILLGGFTHRDSVLDGFEKGEERHKIEESPAARLQENERVLRERMGHHKFVEILEAKLFSSKQDRDIASELGLRDGSFVDRTISMCRGMLSARYTFSAELVLRGAYRPSTAAGILQRDSETNDSPRAETPHPVKSSPATPPGGAIMERLPERINSVRAVEQVIALCRREKVGSLPQQFAPLLREALEAFKELRESGKNFKCWLTELGTERVDRLLKDSPEIKLSADVLVIMLVRSGSSKIFGEQFAQALKEGESKLTAEEVGGEFCKILPKIRSATLALKSRLEADGTKLKEPHLTALRRGVAYIDETSVGFIADVMHRVGEKERELLSRVEYHVRENLKRAGKASKVDSSDSKSPAKKSLKPSPQPKKQKERELPVEKAAEMEEKSVAREPDSGSKAIYKGTPENIYDGLVNARNADYVRLTFQDGRVMSGSVTFNTFRGMGRIINIDEEFAVDFRSDDIEEVEIG